MRKYLLVTGGLAWAVTAMPWLVLFGYIAFIIPGLLLSVMPVAFGYGCLFAAIRFGAMMWSKKRPSQLSPFKINAVAALGTVILLILIPAIFNAEARFRLNHYRLESVEPTGAIPIGGDIRFEQQFDHFDCVDACRALLQRPGVRSVTVGKPPIGDFAALRDGIVNSTARTFRLRADSACRMDGASMTDAVAQRCLLEGPTPDHYDMLIRQGEWREWSDGYSNGALRWPISARFAEVRSGNSLYARVWLESTQTLGMPLAAFPMCGGVFGTQMCWWRENLGSIRNGTNPSALSLIKGER